MRSNSAGRELSPLVTGDTAPVSEQIFMLPLTAKHRGLLRPGRFVVAMVFPLGLFRACSWVSLSLRCVVYPAADRSAQELDIRNASLLQKTMALGTRVSSCPMMSLVMAFPGYR